MTERTYHHGNLRAALLDRAWDVVDAEGADALSLRRLARDAGVSHGASARHFRDKQALLDALAIAGFQRLNAALADAVDSPGSFAERFGAAGDAYVSFAVKHPAILRSMYTAKHHAAASAELVEVSHVAMPALVALITAAQDAGELPPGPAEEAAVVAFAAVHGVATLATDDLLNGFPWRDATAATIASVWRGLSSVDAPTVAP
ncbi:TetR/AcrR family transcriptional regulator [Microbacterium trichothecenolyticum]|uniref:HTH-type transcriptional regulator BetI n=1 Tax=Microbacterium trichothecenolyticum TaxID=69370 RepID=A0A0M2HF20_MICTR|nr:TetR/AcrR family transcriptional regulator [Microbacterium trichothecenolyticum]KJL42868.1 HTH-type transcriptional regulator BetI [Microbacterium trichothecenolyticum]